MNKIFDSELKVLKVLWERGDSTAKEIADVLADQAGWHPNTTYTVIKKCITKGYVERIQPDFICHVLIKEQEVVNSEAKELADKYFDGSIKRLFVALAENVSMSEEMREELRKIIK